MQRTMLTPPFKMQIVVVTDGALAAMVLGNRLSLDKALEPGLSDELLSIGSHHTMFSAGKRGLAGPFSNNFICTMMLCWCL